MQRFKANRPCAVSAGAEAAAMVDSANLKIERLLVKNELFRVRNAYFFAFMFSYSSKEHVKLEGKTIKFRNLPTFLFSKIGRKSVKYLLSGKLEGLRISAAEVFDTFFPSSRPL